MDPAAYRPATRHATAKDYIYDALTSAIYEGHYVPGARLLEKEVSAWLNVSRTPVREALTALAGDGLVEIEPHRGAVVRRIGAEDIRDLYIVRAALESLAIELAVARMPEDLPSLLRDLDRDIRAASTAGDIEEVLDLNRRFHLSLYEHCGSVRLTDSIMSAWRRAEYFRRHVYGSAEGAGHEEDVHARMLAAVEAHDGLAAGVVVKESLLAMGDKLARSLDAAGEDPT